MNCRYFPERPSVVFLAYKKYSAHIDIIPLPPLTLYIPISSCSCTRNQHPRTAKMSAKSFLELVGVSPSKATVENSTLVIIDAQNECVFPRVVFHVQTSLTEKPTRYADGHLKTVNIASTRASIASLLDKYRAKADPSQIVHIVHATPEGAPVFTPKSTSDSSHPRIFPSNPTLKPSANPLTYLPSSPTNPLNSVLILHSFTHHPPKPRTNPQSPPQPPSPKNSRNSPPNPANTPSPRTTPAASPPPISTST